MTRGWQRILFGLTALSFLLALWLAGIGALSRMGDFDVRHRGDPRDAEPFFSVSTGHVTLILFHHVFSFRIWLLIAFFAQLPLIRLIRLIQRKRLPLPGHCKTCGYDLRATPDRCPECGTVTTEATSLSSG